MMNIKVTFYLHHILQYRIIQNAALAHFSIGGRRICSLGKQENKNCYTAYSVISLEKICIVYALKIILCA